MAFFRIEVLHAICDSNNPYRHANRSESAGVLLNDRRLQGWTLLDLKRAELQGGGGLVCLQQARSGAVLCLACTTPCEVRQLLRLFLLSGRCGFSHSPAVSMTI